MFTKGEGRFRARFQAAEIAAVHEEDQHGGKDSQRDAERAVDQKERTDTDSSGSAERGDGGFSGQDCPSA